MTKINFFDKIFQNLNRKHYFFSYLEILHFCFLIYLPVSVGKFVNLCKKYLENNLKWSSKTSKNSIERMD